MNKAEEYVNELKKTVDFLNQILNNGASETEVEELEQFTNQRLPKSYTNLLKIANGEGKIKLGVLGLFFSSIDRVKHDIEFFRKSPSVFPESIYQYDLVKPNLYNKSRIPFATDESGLYLCIDYDPDLKGKKGQIIYLPCAEPEPVSVIANDFDSFLEFIIASLKSKRMWLYDGREDWAEEDWDEWREYENSDYSKVETYFIRNWKQDWTDIAEEYDKKNK